MREANIIGKGDIITQVHTLFPGFDHRRDKIFNIHFRNISGGKLCFMETFPDEGDIDMDMVRSLKLYHELGYEYMFMPDHGSTISARDPVGVAFAFCYGYIAALIEALGNKHM